MVKTYQAKRAIARGRAQRTGVIQMSPEALRAQVDFPWFCEYMSRRSELSLKPANHMRLWHEHLVTGQSSECLIGIAGPNTDILAPRGSAKSTVLAMYCAWAIGVHALHHKLLKILYLSYSIDVARPKSAIIKNLILTPEYQEIFPMVKRGTKWADEYWSINLKTAGISAIGQEVFSVLAAGLKGGIVSKRSHLIVLDDLIKSPEDIANPEIREVMEQNWLNLVKPTMLPGARAVCLGTRFTKADIHCTMFTPVREWVQIEQSALIEQPDGQEVSYWPEMYSTEFLQAKRDGPDGDPVSFSLQYQNKIPRISGISIQPEWIKREEATSDPRDYDALVVGCDLASSLKERADFTVFLLAGRKGSQYFMLDMRRGKWMGNIEKLDQLLEMLYDWDIIGCENFEESPSSDRIYTTKDVTLIFRPESVAYQDSLAGDFKSYVHTKHKLYNLVVRPHSLGKRDKLSRLRGVSGLFENGCVIWNTYRQMGVAINELLEFGVAAHDDCVDATTTCLDGLRKNGGVQSA